MLPLPAAAAGAMASYSGSLVPPSRLGRALKSTKVRGQDRSASRLACYSITRWSRLCSMQYLDGDCGASPRELGHSTCVKKTWTWSEVMRGKAVGFYATCTRPADRVQGLLGDNCRGTEYRTALFDYRSGLHDSASISWKLLFIMSCPM